MERHKSAFIFPAFVREYIGTETDITVSLKGNLKELLGKASQVIDPELIHFDIRNNHFLDDELRSQYIAYIYSCCISDVLNTRNIVPDYVAGYSMGLYAALYHCKSIDFETGLKLICNAFRIIHKNTNGKIYGMGVIGGLERDDIEKLRDKYAPSVEVINKNSTRTYVISGPAGEIHQFLEQALNEGAMHSKLLNVTSPYHSSFLDKAAAAFAEYLEHIEIRNPEYVVVSAIDQSPVNSIETVKNELIDNIHSKINWYKTFCFMLDKDVNTFIECGAGKTLYKISRFIDGEFSVYPITKIHLII